MTVTVRGRIKDVTDILPELERYNTVSAMCRDTEREEAFLRRSLQPTSHTPNNRNNSNIYIITIT